MGTGVLLCDGSQRGIQWLTLSPTVGSRNEGLFAYGFTDLTILHERLFIAPLLKPGGYSEFLGYSVASCNPILLSYDLSEFVFCRVVVVLDLIRFCQS